jgi:hypothetical protein
LATSDGAVAAFGSAEFYGAMAGRPMNAPVTAIAATPTLGGYWLLAADGAVFAFGDAGFFGAGTAAAAPFVDLVPTATGRGYWLLQTDGSVLAFGDAQIEKPRPPGETGPRDRTTIGVARSQPSPASC